MWCLETIIENNQRAEELAREGKPERDAIPPPAEPEKEAPTLILVELEGKPLC
jgi:hypothetical protein